MILPRSALFIIKTQNTKRQPPLNHRELANLAHTDQSGKTGSLQRVDRPNFAPMLPSCCPKPGAAWQIAWEAKPRRQYQWASEVVEERRDASKAHGT